MDQLQYYKLKEKYQQHILIKKDKIKKDKSLSITQKQLKCKKIIKKCVNCGKKGGTIFEEKYGMLKASCGSKEPCDLNINIKRILYDDVRDLLKHYDKQSENLKMRIIITKLDYLFGINNSKQDIIDRFDTLKNELANIAEKIIILNTNYGNIINNIKPDPLLNDDILNLENEINEIKKLHKESLHEDVNESAYIMEIIEKYITVIEPLSEKIRNIKYDYCKIEYNDDDTFTLATYPYYKNKLEREIS